MKDASKTKQQLIAGLEQLRRQQAVTQAADRIRDEVLAMRRNQDMDRICGLMWQALVQLGVEIDAFNLALVDEQRQTTLARFVMSNEKARARGYPRMQTDIVPGAALVYPVVTESEFYKAHGLPTGRSSHIDTGLSRTTEQQISVWQRFKKNWGVEFNVEIEQKRKTVSVLFPRGNILLLKEVGRHGFTQDDVRIAETFASVIELAHARSLDFKRLESQNQALKAANQEITATTQRKSQFLASMSHDLRTPMNAIIGYTRILKRRGKDALEPRLYKNLENIETSSNSLLTLINEILDLSKIEAGRIEAVCVLYSEITKDQQRNVKCKRPLALSYCL